MLTKEQIIARLTKEATQGASSTLNKELEEKLDILATIAESLPCHTTDDLDTIAIELNVLLNSLFNVRLDSFLAEISTVETETLISILEANRRVQKLELAFPNSPLRPDTKSMAASVFTIVQLNSFGTTYEDAYLVDLLSIAGFLANKSECHTFFADLEEKLQQHAIDKGAKLATYKDGLQKLADDKDKPFNKQKILSSFFYQWAKDNGYNKEKYARVQGLLSRNEFLALLDEKVILKDTGVTMRHGIWSHVIQQYLINAKNNKKQFLIHSPADIYAYLGQKNNAATTSKDLSTWDSIFDRDESLHDCRSPENIHDELSTDVRNIKNMTAKYPILSVCATQYKVKPLEEEGRNSKKTYHFVYFKPAPRPVDFESKLTEGNRHTKGQLSS